MGYIIINSSENQLKSHQKVCFWVQEIVKTKKNNQNVAIDVNTLDIFYIKVLTVRL